MIRAIFGSLTFRGKLFISLGTTILIVGLGLGMNDLTRIGLLMLALTFFAAFMARRHSLTFQVARQARPARVQIDQATTVELTIDNPSRQRSPVLAAEEMLDYTLGDRPRFIIPALRRGERHAVSYPVRSHVRGRHRLGPLALAVADPFGLTARSVALQSTADLIVLPRVVPLGNARLGAHGTGQEGTIPHMVALHGEDDVSVREYRHGDDLRRVHWPATARTGDLMVRQEDRPAMRRTVIFLDSRESVHGPTTSRSLEWAVTMAASVVAHYSQRGYVVHLVTASDHPGIGADSPHLDTSLEALALVTPGGDDSLPGVLQMTGAAAASGGLLVAIVGGCSDADARSVASLRAPGSTGVALIVDQETISASASASRTLTRPAATAELLRQAGWHTVIVDQSLGFSDAWTRLNQRPSLSGATR